MTQPNTEEKFYLFIGEDSIYSVEWENFLVLKASYYKRAPLFHWLNDSFINWFNEYERLSELATEIINMAIGQAKGTPASLPINSRNLNNAGGVE